MLEISNLTGGYGQSQILFDVSLIIGPGEVVALLGRNGMGKTTTVHTLMGMLPAWGGTIRFEGRDITGLPPFRVAQLGVGLVPEGRRIFPTLNVEENLIATATDGPWTLERIWTLFPRLRERRGNAGSALSGGEQQMLAIGRALATNPRLLIMDEATEGLAPVIRSEIWAVLETLKSQGLSILLIDKNLSAVLRLADRGTIIEKGRIVWSGTSNDLARDTTARDTYLHL